MKEKKVSVVMPVYNAKKYVARAIDSILNQTYKNLELIIVLDAPTDGSDKIVNSYNDERIHVLVNVENKGIAYSTNLGLDYSTGEYIALMDDDDIAMEKRLETSVSFLENHSDIDLLGGGALVIDDEDRIIKVKPTPRSNPNLIKSMLLFRDWITNGTVIFRKSVVKNNNIRYREGYLGMQDFLFFVEVSKVCKMSSVGDIFLLYRWHEQNETVLQQTSNNVNRRKKYAEIQKKSIESSGFKLNEVEFEIIKNYVGECMNASYSLNDIKQLKKVLEKMIRQAKENDMEEIDELRWVCRKILADRLVRTDIL